MTLVSSIEIINSLNSLNFIPTELQIRDYVRNQKKLPEALVNSIMSQVDVMEEIEAQEAEMEIQNEVEVEMKKKTTSKQKNKKRLIFFFS